MTPEEERLIRKRADEPETVARLARSQERELRAWLYTDRPAPGTSVADAFTDLAGEVEDRHGVAVDVVCVGDRSPDRDTEVIVAATREALSNAVRHGGARTVTARAEERDGVLSIRVRDDGGGPREGHRIGLGLSGMREAGRRLPHGHADTPPPRRLASPLPRRGDHARSGAVDRAPVRARDRHAQPLAAGDDDDATVEPRIGQLSSSPSRSPLFRHSAISSSNA